MHHSQGAVGALSGKRLFPLRGAFQPLLQGISHPCHRLGQRHPPGCARAGLWPGVPETSRSSDDRSLPTNPQQRYSGSPGRDKVPFPVHWGDNWPRLPLAPLPAVPQLRDRGQSAPFRAGIGAAEARTALHAGAAEEGGASSQLLTPEAPPRWLRAREEGPDSGGRNGDSGPPVQAAPGNACFAVPQRVWGSSAPEGGCWGGGAGRRARAAAEPPITSLESEKLQAENTAGIFWLKSPILQM